MLIVAKTLDTSIEITHFSQLEENNLRDFLSDYFYWSIICSNLHLHIISPCLGPAKLCCIEHNTKQSQNKTNDKE